MYSYVEEVQEENATEDIPLVVDEVHFGNSVKGGVKNDNRNDDRKRI